MMDMTILLRKKPNPSGHFQWMVDWENISSTAQDNEAHSLYLKGSNKYCDLVHVYDSNKPINLLAFLRYDYKKVLVRVRYLYIDRLRNYDITSKNVIKPTDLDCAYFEPALLCFPNLEFLGRLQYPELYNEDKDTWNVLSKILTQMGDGYATYVDKLINWHRNALSHELRPDGNWTDDLNTEGDYGPPKWKDGRLYLNIPHFIDSCLLQIENLCEQLTGSNAQDVMAKYSMYISKRFAQKIATGTK